MGGPPDDSDPAILDWPEGEKTELDKTVVRPVSDVITAPHDLAAIAGSVEAEIAAAREDACRSCFGEGQRDAVSAFALTFRDEGLTEEEIKNILLTVEGKLTRL